MKISTVQLFWLTATFELATTLLFTISPTLTEAKQDAWISIIFAALASISVTFIALYLSRLYPNQSIMDFSRSIMGKWFGKLILLPYLVHWYLEIAITLRQSSALIMLSLFHRTPIYVVMILIFITVIHMTYVGGIESIGRLSELAGPIIYITFLIIFILCIKNVHFTKVLPIYADTGLMQIVKGSIFPFSFLGQSILLLVLNRFIKEPKKSGFGVIWGLILSIFFLLFSTFLVISTFGPGLSNKMYFPFYEVVRFTSVAEFIQNVEVFLVLAWILCVFVKLSLFLFVSSYSTAQLINMKSWKKAIWFVALITMAISLWFQNINTATIEFPKKYMIPYLVPLNYVVIPMLLLIIGLIKRKNKEES